MRRGKLPWECEYCETEACVYLGMLSTSLGPLCVPHLLDVLVRRNAAWIEYLDIRYFIEGTTRQ